MGDKGILGGKVANVIDIHQEALHLALEPEMMLILLLMKSHKKLPVIKNTRMLPRPLRNSAFSGFSGRSVRQMGVTSQWIESCCCLNTFNRLSEALVLNVLKTKRRLGRVRVYSIN